jgi:hypothetical protein
MRLGEHRKALGIKAGCDFHSYRTTLISCLQFNGCPAEHRKIFVGHESGDDVHSVNYSKAEFTPERLTELIWPFLDYEKFIGFTFPDWRYQPGRFDAFFRKSAGFKKRRAARMLKI